MLLSLLRAVRFQLVDEGGGGTTYNGLYSKDLIERGTFFMLEVYKG